MKGPCRTCGQILHLEYGECHRCRDKSDDLWLLAAIVLVIVGVLLAWFGVDYLSHTAEQLNGN